MTQQSSPADLTAGQQLQGIDLGGGYTEIPAGWPQR